MANEKLQIILTEIPLSANDADNLKENMTLRDWQTMLSNLEAVHYYCMDARNIVKRKIRDAKKLPIPAVKSSG